MTIETKIAEAIVDRALAANYTITVYDSYDNDGEFVLLKSTNKAEVLAAMFSTDGDTLIFRDATDTLRIGSIQFVWGNDEDCVHDHTNNDEMQALVG